MRKRRAAALDANNRDFLLDDVHSSINELMPKCVSLHAALVALVLFRQRLQAGVGGHPCPQEATNFLDNRVLNTWLALLLCQSLLVPKKTS